MPSRRAPLIFRTPALTLLRVLLFAFALPCVYLGAASAAYYYHRRAAATGLDSSRFSVLPSPQSTTRLMVFAPHCDDETLGCAGLMQQTLAAGGRVQVGMLTNGDAFRAAVECQTHKLRIEADDYIRFAALRQEESCRALGALGVTRANIHFFGYPDRGLMPIWIEHWSPEQAYYSTFTRCDRSPYTNTYLPNTVYCGENVVNDIKESLRAFRPNLITVTHPAEDHPDHAAAAAFVMRALLDLQADPREAAWAKKTRLRYYLVHRGDWPAASLSTANAALLPPEEMVHTDTHWSILPLTADQTARKSGSVALYPSQTAMMGSFMNGFARRTELYGEIPPVTLRTVPDATMKVDADTREWRQLTPVLIDPVRDDVLRQMQGGGDISALYACRDSNTLYVRLDCRQPLSRSIVYTLHLRAFGENGMSAPEATVIALHTGETGPMTSIGSHHKIETGVVSASEGRTLEIAIPLARLSRLLPEASIPSLAVPSLAIRSLAISAETSLSGVEIDKTGVRFLQFP